MRVVLIAGAAVLLAAVVAVYGTLAAMLLAGLRDWLHSWVRVRRMRRSGESKRVVPESVVTWVVDECGNVIDSVGNSWTVTG